MKSIVLAGLLLGLLLAFPQLLVPVAALARYAASQPLLWAFAAGVIARPWIARRIPFRGGTR